MMQKLLIRGGRPLKGTIRLAGAKNVALKMIVASLLTDKKLTIRNVPDISDVTSMIEVVKSLGVSVKRSGSTLTFIMKSLKNDTVPLEVGGRLRTSSMVIGPLLSRFGKAVIPNPGGCRLGARPIDRHIDGIAKMGATISYNSDDGYFYAEAPDGLHGVEYVFPKNTHTGTETMILAAVVATGTTVLKNAAEEVEIDDLIALLNAMGASIRRRDRREIEIVGVASLHGAEHTIMSDRNEEVTYAIAAALTGGEITVKRSEQKHLKHFFQAFRKAGGGVRVETETITTYFRAGRLKSVDVQTSIHPGFMTDWQAPWAVLMTQAEGESVIHETVFERRFSYVSQLQKMGAHISFFHPQVDDPKRVYNFNLSDKPESHFQAIKIKGPNVLHNAVLEMADLRAGATLVLAALVARGTSVIYGVHHIDRGYESIDSQLESLGADILREKEESV